MGRGIAFLCILILFNTINGSCDVKRLNTWAGG